MFGVFTWYSCWGRVIVLIVLCNSTLFLFVWLNKQNLRWADELHVPGGAEGGMLLAKQAGGQLLYPGPQALLPRLLAVRPPPPGPSQRHPGPLHRCAHPGYPTDDGPGGVEEQTQWGDRVVNRSPGLSLRFGFDSPLKDQRNFPAFHRESH